MIKRYFLVICLFMSVLGVYSQDNGNDEKISLSVDFASGFVWRGIAFNTSPVVQPEVSLNLGRFSFGAWASTPFTQGKHTEFDLYVFCEITPSISIGLLDYFDYDASNSMPPSYFEYGKNKTTHTLDLMVMYDGSGAFPIKAMASTIIAGADLNDDGKRNFSTYIELGYENTTRNNIDWEVFMGFVPMKSTGFYEVEKPGFLNLGLGVTKTFEITPTYSLPLSLKLGVNPHPDHQSVFLKAAIKLF